MIWYNLCILVIILLSLVMFVCSYKYISLYGLSLSLGSYETCSVRILLWKDVIYCLLPTSKCADMSVSLYLLCHELALYSEVDDDFSMHIEQQQLWWVWLLDIWDGFTRVRKYTKSYELFRLQFLCRLYQSAMIFRILISHQKHLMLPSRSFTMPEEGTPLPCLFSRFFSANKNCDLVCCHSPCGTMSWYAFDMKKQIHTHTWGKLCSPEMHLLRDTSGNRNLKCCYQCHQDWICYFPAKDLPLPQHTQRWVCVDCVHEVISAKHHELCRSPKQVHSS